MDTLGNPMIYQNWHSTKPDNSGNCAFMNFLENGKWGDTGCDVQLECFMCQSGGSYCEPGWVKVGKSCVQVRVSISYTGALQ